MPVLITALSLHDKSCLDKGGLHDYLQWRAGLSATHWENLLETRLRRQTVTTKTRAERLAEEANIAREIDAMNVPVLEKERLFRERTGKSIGAYYRRLKNGHLAN